jgi:hypothetical protein
MLPPIFSTSSYSAGDFTFERFRQPALALLPQAFLMCSEGCSHICVIVQREATACFDIWKVFPSSSCPFAQFTQIERLGIIPPEIGR